MTRSRHDASTDPIHVIVISSVRPEPTSGGPVILYRHLVNQPGIVLEVYGNEPQRPTISRFIRRVGGRLSRTWLHRFVEDFWVLWEGRWIDPELPCTVSDPSRTVVVTVAHGDGFMAARRFAQRHGLPLVAWFMDWWPDIPDLHRAFRVRLEANYRSLYASAGRAVCVSAGMNHELGENPRSIILHDLPAAATDAPLCPVPRGAEFRVFYSGNLTEYGPMLGQALVESLRHPEMLLQVRGANPSWPDELRNHMRNNGRWLDFAPRAELDAWLASADAFLVLMAFDPALRRRMGTSFPSKLIEFAKFGKPLIVWGPEYCSAIQWARTGNKALCITDPSPAALIEGLHHLRDDAPLRAALSDKARAAAAAEFNPAPIRSRFRELLHEVIKPASSTT
ncbi:MAG: hypothetical protein MUF04_05305 [Akkermansiaceae bacterium]|jgi:glycosyltransferase involved in cell wall biosynthesis|nr:hypothetical protein [Akkermansiaceae bacterium]